MLAPVAPRVGHAYAVHFIIAAAAAAAAAPRRRRPTPATFEALPIGRQSQPGVQTPAVKVGGVGKNGCA